MRVGLSPENRARNGVPGQARFPSQRRKAPGRQIQTMATHGRASAGLWETFCQKRHPRCPAAAARDDEESKSPRYDNAGKAGGRKHRLQAGAHAPMRNVVSVALCREADDSGRASARLRRACLRAAIACDAGLVSVFLCRYVERAERKLTRPSDAVTVTSFMRASNLS